MPDPAMIECPVLKLQVSELDGAVVVRCSGSMTLESSDFFKREVKSRIPEKGKLIVDLSDVSRMDSSGLGAMVGVYLSARGKSCELELINLNKQIRNLFAISNLLSVFETFGPQGIRMP